MPGQGIDDAQTSEFDLVKYSQTPSLATRISEK